MAISKRSAKSFAKPAAAVKSNSNAIPTPFTTAPAGLHPLLPQLDPARVHLIHIDRHTPEHKKQIVRPHSQNKPSQFLPPKLTPQSHQFIIPLLLNTLVALALAYRAYTALPFYYNLLLTLTGDASSPTTLNPSTTPQREALKAILLRSATFLFDFILVRFLGVWPLAFFFAQPSNPTAWRWQLGGFQAEEVVVRASRNWGVKELLEGVAEGVENEFFTGKILPAIERSFVRSKTGYLMMNGTWELDFATMLDAHTLVARGAMQFADVDRVVLACLPGQHGWVCWRWEVEGDVIEHRRKKVVLFKEVLVALGKESLFWRWAEIVEEERDGDGGFSVAGQKKVVERVQAEFEREGVDFEEVVGRIGGLEEVADAAVRKE
jgi:hypothetical protein